MKANRSLVSAAAFLVVSAIMLVAAGIVLGGAQLSSGPEFTAIFSTSNGLKPDDQVQAAGVEVGRVVSVSLQDNNLVAVRFNVDGDVHLDRGTTAAIRIRSLTGVKLLDLGDSGRNHTPLPPGGTIPLKNTDPGVNLDEVFGSFQAVMQGLDPAAINQLSSSIIEVFSGESGNVDALLSNLSSVIGTFSDRAQVVDSLISNFKSVLSTVDQQGAAMDQTVVNLRALVSGLARNRALITSSVSAISTLTRDGAAYIEGIRPALNVLVTQTGRLAAGINTNLPLLTHYLQVLPSVVTALGRLGSYGSFYGLYICGAAAEVSVPGGGILHIPMAYDSAPRCQFNPGKSQ